MNGVVVQCAVECGRLEGEVAAGLAGAAAATNPRDIAEAERGCALSEARAGAETQAGGDLGTKKCLGDA